jgi:predicted nucleic acid-binding protein
MPVSDACLDTNILPSACLAEPASSEVRAWFDRTVLRLITSDRAALEFSGALGIEVRRRELTPRQSDRATAVFDTDLQPTSTLLATDHGVVHAAAILLRTCELGLRSGDAMHLAFCIQGKRTAPATADRALASAAKVLAIEVEQVY